MDIGSDKESRFERWEAYMTARALIQFINTPASELLSLKRRILKRLLDAVSIDIVTLTSILIRTIISSILLSGVE